MEKFCSNCGKKLSEDEKFCMVCGKNQQENIVGDTHYANRTPDNKDKFLPSFILGLIASIFGIFGGLCVTMCSSIYSSGMEAFIFIIGGSVVGLIGACKCLSNAKIGSILELIGAIMITICAFGITGADGQTVIALVLFYISGAIGLLHSLFKTIK